MPSIDERIVQMQFDNKEFEKNIQVSMKSLEELKKGLELDEAAKSLKKIENAVDSFDMSGLSRSIETIAGRFTNLGVIGVTALQNIANKAVDAGTKLVKSLTIDQLGVGFDKYAQKTKAVQTIVNATGMSIDQVDQELSKLVWYADETSYSFTDMVSNIGKFTSMRIPLDDSVSAMMGISNWAAKAGQGINEAGRAMYNLSQAMGLGYVQMLDWRSIQNANMATAEFKEQAIDAAKALGILDDAGRIAGTNTVVNLESFESTLQNKWFTKDVLLDVLKQYGQFSDQVYEVFKSGKNTNEAIEELSGTCEEFAETAFKAAQEAKTFREAIDATAEASASKWMETFELIFGNYEEAKKLWTDLANDLYEIFVESGDERNELLKSWKEIGGRDTFLEGLYNSMSALKGVIAAVREAIASIFPSTTAEQLKSITEKFRDWTATLNESLGLVQKFAGYKTIITKYEFQGIEEWKEFLKRGAKGEDVKKMQERLMEAGYALDKFGADGIFGPETEAALKQFQKDMGIIEDGYGKKTHEALGKKLGLTGKDGVKSAEKVDKFVDAVNPKLQNFQRIVSGAAAVLKLFFNLVGFGVKVVGSLIDTLSPLGSLLMDIFGFIGDMFVGLNDSVEKGNVFNNWLLSIQNTLLPVKAELQSFTEWIRKLIFGTKEAPTIFGQLRDGTLSFSDAWDQAKKSLQKSKVVRSLSLMLNKMSPTFDKIKNKVKTFYNTAKQYFAGKIPQVFGALSAGVSNAVAGIFDFITMVYEAITGSEALQNAWEKFKTFVTTFGGTLKEFGKSAWESISKYFKGKSVKDIWSDLKTSLGSVGDFISDKFNVVKDKIKEFLEAHPQLNQAFTTVKTKVIAAKTAISNFITTLVEAVNNFIGTDTSEIEGFWPKMQEKLKAFDPVVEYFTNFKTTINEAWENIKAVFTQSGDEEGGLFATLKDSLNNFTAQFGDIDLKDILKKALIGVGAALLVKGLFDIGSLISGFKKFASAWLYKNGGGAGNVINSVGKALLSAGGSALMMGTGVALVVMAIHSLLDIVKDADNEEALDKAVGIVRSLVLAMMGIETVVSASGIFNKSKNSINVGGALAIGVGIWLVIESIGKLAALYDSYNGKTSLEDAIKDVTNLIGIFATADILKAMTATKFEGNFLGALSSGSGMVGLAWALKIVVQAIGELAEIYKTYSNEQLRGAINNVRGLILILGGTDIIRAMTESSFEVGALGALTSGSGMVGLAYALKMVVEAIGQLAGLYEKYNSGNQLENAITNIGGLLVTLGGISVAEGALTKDIWGKVVGGGGVIALAYALQMIIEAFGEVMPKIQDVNPVTLAVFAGALDVALIAMAGALKALSTINFGGSVNLAVLFGALSAGIAIMGSITNSQVNSFSATIQNVGGRLATFSSEMQSVDKTSFDKAKELITMMAELFADENVFGANADNFVVALSRISGAFAIFSLGTLGVNADKVSSIKGLADNIEYACNKIKGITDVEGISKTLTDISGALGLYFKTQDGIDLTQTVGPDAIKAAIEGLAQAIPSDESFSEIQAFASKSEDDSLSQMAIGIQNIATALKSYGDNISEIDPGKVETANSVLDKISSIKDKEQSVNDFDSFTGTIAGKAGSFGLFIVDIAALGLALRSYGNSIGGLNKDKVELANTILSSISNVSLNPSGGVWQALTGEKSLGTFAVNIGEIGSGMAKYMTAINDTTFDKDKVTASLEPLSIIADADSKMSRSGGFAALLAGSKNFGKLADGVITFTTTLTNSKNLALVKSVNPRDYDNMVEVLDVITSLQQRLIPADGGGVDFSFANLSGSLIPFLEEIEDIANDESLMGALQAVGLALTFGIGEGISQGFAEGKISEALPEIPSQITQYFVDNYSSIVGIGKAIAAGLASGMTQNETAIQGAVTSIIEGLIDASFLDDADKVNPKQYRGVFKVLNIALKIRDKMAMLDDGNNEFSFNNMTSSLSGFLQQMSGLANDPEIVGNSIAVGEALSGNIGDGMSKNSGKVSSAASKIPSKITSVFSSYYNNFVNVGKAIDMGIAKGITDNTNLVTDAIQTLIQDALDAANEKAEINSPSRLFARVVGKGLDEGTAKGLYDNSHLVTDAAEYVISDSTKNLQNGLNVFTDSLNLPIDDRPTIRPVLDLSDVNAGVSSMNGMFGNRTVGVTSSGMANSIANTRYSRFSQSTTTQSDSVDVSRAISVLNEKMGSLEKAITNMKVVTETGAIIGQIARGMDKKLGQFANMHERGG